jgi:hypothetical protein
MQTKGEGYGRAPGWISGRSGVPRVGRARAKRGPDSGDRRRHHRAGRVKETRSSAVVPPDGKMPLRRMETCQWPTAGAACVPAAPLHFFAVVLISMYTTGTVP